MFTFDKGCSNYKGKPYFTTWSGIRFEIFDIKPNMINIKDIAHALSINRRFGGHTNRGYSIGQHSNYVRMLVPDKHKLRAGLHDASEAYTNDLMTPYKRHPDFKPMVDFEHHLQKIIFERFGLEEDAAADAIIKEADLAMLYFEVKQLTNHDWWQGMPKPNFTEFKIEKLSDEEVELKFLQNFLDDYNATTRKSN